MTVRVRVTLVAVAVTAIALAIGGWGIVRSVERTQLGKITKENDERVDAVVDQIAAGIDPFEVQLSTGPGTGLGIVQVIGSGCDVLTATPPFADDPLVGVTTRCGVAGGGERTWVLATDRRGGGTIEDPVPGLVAAGIPLQVRYERVGDVTVVAASPLEEVSRSLDAVRRALWFGLPLFVALVGGVTWFVTGRALRPVEAIRAEVEAVSGSTLHRRVPEPAGDDEISRLARTMNAMLDRLEAASDRQRRFVADASHELRSPVAALRTELEVARIADDTDGLRSAVDGALAEEERVEAMLGDLLLLASVEEVPQRPEEDVDLAAVVGAECERTRRVPVACDVANPATVVGSTSQLRRVVANLVDNAARHAASRVELGLDGARIVVDDDGPGIPEAERERVFERFHRLDEARAREAGGTGLGLAIVRALVERHGGRVWVERAPIGGARLAVDLPAKRT